MTPSNSPDARVARPVFADCTNDRHAARSASECLDVAPRTETIAGSDCTVQSGPFPLLDSYHNACPYAITNAMPSSTIGRPTLLLTIPNGPTRAIAHLPPARHVQPTLMADKANVRGNRHEAARARLLSGTPRAEPAPATSMKRARRESPPSSPQQNTVAFPSADHAAEMPKPVGKRLRMLAAQHPLPSIGEESEAIDETLVDACLAPRARLNSYSFTTTARTSSRRKSRRQRLYAAQFPARSFVPRLESITEAIEPEALLYLACETASHASTTKSNYDGTTFTKTLTRKTDPSRCEGGAGRRRSLTLIEPLRGAWRRLRRADDEQ